MTEADKNSLWIVHVREYLRAGYGVEDIAIKTGTSVEAVRAEADILRELGVFTRSFFEDPTAAGVRRQKIQKE